MEAEDMRDTTAKIFQLQCAIDKHHMKSFHTNGTTENKSERGDDDDRGAGATDCVELEAHGYEVEPRDVVDENGFVIIESFSNVRQPLSTYAALTLDLQMPSHILTVYQQSDPSKRFVAKKVSKQSNELEFLKRLNTLQPKSEHIISLHESFQTQSTSWAILPEMDPVAWFVSFAPNELYGKVAQVCRGLIKGVAYLHKFCIAHRDIKPENLVVDRDLPENYRLRIRYTSKGRGRGGRWPMRDGGLAGARDGGEVGVQPDQGRPVVNRASSSLSSEQVQERRQGSEYDCEEADHT